MTTQTSAHQCATETSSMFNLTNMLSFHATAAALLCYMERLLMSCVVVAVLVISRTLLTLSLQVTLSSVPLTYNSFPITINSFYCRYVWFSFSSNITFSVNAFSLSLFAWPPGPSKIQFVSSLSIQVNSITENIQENQ